MFANIKQFFTRTASKAKTVAACIQDALEQEREAMRSCTEALFIKEEWQELLGELEAEKELGEAELAFLEESWLVLVDASSAIVTEEDSLHFYFYQDFLAKKIARIEANLGVALKEGAKAQAAFRLRLLVVEAKQEGLKRLGELLGGVEITIWCLVINKFDNLEKFIFRAGSKAKTVAACIQDALTQEREAIRSCTVVLYIKKEWQELLEELEAEKERVETELVLFLRSPGWSCERFFGHLHNGRRPQFLLPPRLPGKENGKDRGQSWCGSEGRSQSSSSFPNALVVLLQILL
ncbi:hypothetical protein BDB01DRAFT_852675 [Pilobolus umbonatus]|nr:hypothetical protein BDB01DRAFT_852675 [Pilobolus umbonatus]